MIKISKERIQTEIKEHFSKFWNYKDTQEFDHLFYIYRFGFKYEVIVPFYYEFGRLTYLKSEVSCYKVSTNKSVVFVIKSSNYNPIAKLFDTEIEELVRYLEAKRKNDLDEEKWRNFELLNGQYY